MDIVEQMERAGACLDDEDYEKALEILTWIIDNDPENESAYVMRGIAHFSMQQVEMAKSDFEQAVRFDNESDQAHWYLSQVFMHDKDFETARKNIARACEIDPENFVYVADYATIAISQRDAALCIELCSRILSDYPADLFALNMRGRAYIETGDFKNAFRDFERALRERPNDAVIHNNIGHAFAKTGNFEKAVKYLQKSISIDPEQPYPYNNMGYVRYLEGNCDEALEWFDRCFAMNAEYPGAYRNRALTLLKMGRNDDARADFQKARELGFIEKPGDKEDDLLIAL